ncbi:MAG: GDP-mannose-dependent alpha-(1-6)-phosphatidylinositol monomannoside mannosyltransferase [Anaerolineales bacterium]|nr:GDP-mannose-dependent alpha-(1-6)-phosphatidylinositol monomannoside mannosyltransferase [Anaerolineales bacterium]
MRAGRLTSCPKTMPERKRIAVCTAQVPFVRGGAEVLVESLVRELRARDHDVDVVQLPFKWYPRAELVKACLAWRLIDITESGGQPIDLVIATKFPSYVVQHPNKVVWLVHQHRMVYDLFGTEYSDFTIDSRDRHLRSVIQRIDERTLGEARHVFTISRNTAARLAQFNSLRGEPLYHPPKHDGRYRNDGHGDFVFAISRLDRIKRLDGLIRAMAHTQTGVRCRVAGAGPMEPELRRLAAKLGVRGRVAFLGHVDDDHLIDLYATCLAVFFAPYDEDYGYVTLEAFRSGKPVLTAPDSGGVLEFVEHGQSGYVVPAGEPATLGDYIDQLYADRQLAARLGEAGQSRVTDITWDHVIERLTETL